MHHFFVKTERNDLHNRYQTHILNKSSIVTTLCTLPEYSLRDCAIFMPLFCRKDTKNIICGKIRNVKFAAIRDF